MTLVAAISAQTRLLFETLIGFPYPYEDWAALYGDA